MSSRAIVGLSMTYNCKECGSERIAPNVRLAAEAPASSLLGQLRARVCADCGFTELRADNAVDLYLDHTRSVEGSSREPGGRDSVQTGGRLRDGDAANIQCPRCGGVIPAAAKRCPCGWSQDAT